MDNISVLGLGKIGLPLACVLAKNGNNVFGADLNREIVENTNKGINYIKEEPGLSELLKDVVNNRNLSATTDIRSAVKESDIHIIAVPTLIDKNKNVDLSNLNNAAETIGKNMKKGDTIIIESTIPVGTTKHISELIENISGLIPETDFYVVHAPERVMTGTALRDIQRQYPKIVGGLSEKGSDIAKRIYSKINEKGVIVLSSAEAAELVKVAEGVYRDVNIALANELAKFCDEKHLDFIEIKNAANSQPFCSLHDAGNGVGGHCIPVYPYFVLRNSNGKYPVIESSRLVNDGMPAYVCNNFLGMCAEKGIKPKIGVLGLSFRNNVKEDKFSMTYPLVEELKKHNAEMYITDETFSPDELTKRTGIIGMHLSELLSKVNSVILMTDHTAYKTTRFPDNIKIVFDSKNFLDKQLMPKDCTYSGVGHR